MKSKLYFPLLLLCGFLVTSASLAQTNKIARKSNVVTYNDNINSPLTSTETAQIKEVYGTTMNKNVLQVPQRLRDIKNILRNRVEIMTISNPRDQKKCTLLSKVPLMDYYVTDLKRDTNFNPNDFNPLKYLFNYNSYGSHMYRVDNTNYFILIKSQHQ